MFLVKLIRLTLIAVVFITSYLPITINPEFFERNQAVEMSYLVKEG